MIWRLRRQTLDTNIFIHSWYLPLPAILRFRNSIGGHADDWRKVSFFTVFFLSEYRPAQSSVEFCPLGIFQHTSYVSHTNRMWLSISVLSFSSPGPLNATAKRKRQWKRSFKYNQWLFHFVRLSLTDLRRISIRPSTGQSLICGAFFWCMHRAPFHG